MQASVKPEHFKTTWLKQSANLFVADVIGTVVEAGFIANVHKFDEAFPVVSTAITNVMKVPIYYLQRPIEEALALTKNFEGKENYDQRVKKTEAERLDALAQGAYHYTAALTIGWASMWAAEHHLLSNFTKAPKIGSHFFMKDAAIHAGLIALMATPTMSGTTQRLKEGIKCVAKSFGAGEHQAEDLARVSMVSFIPNYLTFAAVSGMLYRDLRLKSLHEQLSATTASSLLR